MKRIDPNDLLDMHEAGAGILRVDLIYADAAHPLNSTFAESIYRQDAKLWLHRDLADIVLNAARRAIDHHVRFVLTDGLRTTDAQRRMAETKSVRANPHWISGGLISREGAGGHPRAMAIDIMLENLQGDIIDMGTALDHFPTDPHDNPAARNYKKISSDAYANRKLLEILMLDAAKEHHRALLPLPSEWWDFRLSPVIYEQYAPLSDADLPPHMRMCA